MTKYAKGRNAVAECQRSGQKMRYRDLVEDGHVPGLLVHPDWWEPKHPQEIPPDMNDPVALYRPSPEISIEADYGNPEAPLPLPTDPIGNDPNTTIALTMTAGDTHVVLDEPLKYDFGLYVFIQLDGGGWFVSSIVSRADSPHITIPFTTPFTGDATAGNQVYVSTGYVIEQQNFDLTLGNYVSNQYFWVGYDSNTDIYPNPHISSASPVDETGRAIVTGDNGIPIHLDAVVQLGSTAVIIDMFEHPLHPGGRMKFDTYSFIEIDHRGGTQVLDTRDIGVGGDMNHSASRDSDYGGYNPDGLIQFYFPWQSEGKSIIWEAPDDLGLTHTVRFIP